MEVMMMMITTETRPRNGIIEDLVILAHCLDGGVSSSNQWL